MIRPPDSLYDLLPAFHRVRDAAQGAPLQALLRVIAEQVSVVDDDITQLYENWFIETCQDWVVPYVGDLIGYAPSHEAGDPSSVTTPRDRLRNAILIPRRDVANTMGHRRRKGTLALLEDLAVDVAGWPARAVEFYTLLGWTQHLDHQRLWRGRTADLRHDARLDLIDGPFDHTAHTVEVRRIASHHAQGRYNIPEVGLFVWRLPVYSVSHTPACCPEGCGPECYSFSFLGNDAPLYNHPQSGAEPTHRPGEISLPVAIRRRAFEDRMLAGGRVISQASKRYYGPDRSVTIWAPGWPRRDASQPIPAEQIIPADLSDWSYNVPRDHVAVDPMLGRIAFPARQLPKGGVSVRYHYAFSAPIGGGEYERIIPQPSVLAASQVRNDDLKDATALAVRLHHHLAADDVASYIYDGATPATQALLDGYDGTAPPSAELQDALVVTLQGVLGDPFLYTPQRFHLYNDHLPDEANALLALSPQGVQYLPEPQLMRLNRLLLETAFAPDLGVSYAIYRVSGDPWAVGRSGYVRTISDALARWRDTAPRVGVIEIADSWVYTERLELELGSGQSLHVRAASGARPIISLLDYMAAQRDAFTITGASGSRCVLDGLLLTGRGLQVYGPDPDPQAPNDGNDLCDLTIRHCTFVSGWGLHCDCEPKRPSEPSLELVNSRAHVSIEHSITGPIIVTADERRFDPIRIDVSDSIVDATSPTGIAVGGSMQMMGYAVLTMSRCTVFGQVRAHALALAENSIFYGVVQVARRQQGCMRFCYAMPGSRTPRRYECQPESAEAAAEQELRDLAAQSHGTVAPPSGADVTAARARARLRVRPRFNSVRYGTPAYAQLAFSCAAEITRGADDEAEMGAFHDLFQPQRAANLRARLDEYTPASMEAGLIYVD